MFRSGIVSGAKIQLQPLLSFCSSSWRRLVESALRHRGLFEIGSRDSLGLITHRDARLQTARARLSTRSLAREHLNAFEPPQSKILAPDPEIQPAPGEPLVFKPCCGDLAAIELGEQAPVRAP